MMSVCPCVRECVCVVLCVHPHISTFQWTLHISFVNCRVTAQYRRAQSPPNDVFLLRFVGVKRTAYLTRDVQKNIEERPTERKESKSNLYFRCFCFRIILSFSLFLSHSLSLFLCLFLLGHFHFWCTPLNRYIFNHTVSSMYWCMANVMH